MEFTERNIQDQTVTVRVNDGDTGCEPFSFEFGRHWVHECNILDRFFGGDEHWTTTAQFGTDWPWFIFRFVGESVRLFGHKVPAGALADVSLDDAPAGRINYRHPERVEQMLLWDSGRLPFGTHTVRVQLIPASDPEAGDAHEASVDFAEVVTSCCLPVTGIGVSRESLVLEPGMVCAVDYALLPAYATETPSVSASSADDATVCAVCESGRCTITARKIGATSVTLKTDTGVKKTLGVTVRPPVVGRLSGMAGQVGRHARQDHYWGRLEAWNASVRDLSVTVWRRDTAAVKLELITGAEAVRGVNVTVGPLTDAQGRVLDAAADCRFITDTLAHDTGRLIPDVIYEGGPADLPAQRLVSVWITVDTSETAEAGTYRGGVTVTDADGGVLVFPLTVTVIGLVLPTERPDLELWQYPYSSNRYYSGQTTADYFPDGRDGMFRARMITDGRMGEGLRSQAALYARAGGRSVTTTIVEDPWNSQTPDPFPSMVKWTKETDGHFTFTYDDFDAWVSLNAEYGIDGRILCFSMSGWGNGITYLDMASGAVVTECLEPNTDHWKAVWTEFLRDFMAHTEEKGWFGRTYLAMDERPAPMVEGVLDLVESVKNRAGECFRTALAVYTFETEHLFGRITDLALAYHMDAARILPIIRERREKGLVTTLYTCGPQYNALNNPPYEGLYTLWFCERMGADGFLRWAQDAFNADPLRSAYHRLFAAGDIYLYYPDEPDAAHPHAHTSPRFEMLAQSARDVAKLRYLRAAAPELAAPVDEAMQALTGHGDLEGPIIRLRRMLDEAAAAYSQRI